MDLLPFRVEELNVPVTLFSSVRYFIAGTIDQKIVKLLEAGGGTKRSSALLATTHVIAGPDADPLSLEEARDVFDLPVVRPSWVAYCAKLGKIVPVAGFSIDKDQLFGNVVASSFGLSQDEVKKLWATLVFYGGGFILDLGPSTTHLIANTSKMPLYGVAKQRNVKVVCIDWINECVKANKLVDAAIYDPSLLKPPPPKIAPVPSRTTVTSVPVTPASPKDVKLHIRNFGSHKNAPVPSRLNVSEKTKGSSPTPALVEQKHKPPHSSPFNQEQLMQLKAQRMQPIIGTSIAPKGSPVGSQLADMSETASQQQPLTPTSNATPQQLQYQLSLQQSKTSQNAKVIAQGTQFAAPVSHALSTSAQQSPLSKPPLQSPQPSPIPQSPTRSPGSSGVPAHMGVQSPGPASQHNQSSINQSGSMTSPLGGHQTAISNAQGVTQIFSQLQNNQQTHSNMQQGQQTFMQSQNQTSVKLGGNQNLSIPTSQNMLMQSHQTVGQQSQSVPQPYQSPQHGGVSSPQGAQQRLLSQSLPCRSPLGIQGSQQMTVQTSQGQIHSPVQNSPNSIQNNSQVQQISLQATDQMSQGNSQMLSQNNQQNFGQNNQGVLSQLQSLDQKDSSNQQDLHHLLNQPICNNQPSNIQLITQSTLGRQQILLHKSGQQIQLQQSHQQGQGNQIIFQQASGLQQHQMLSQNTQNQNQQQSSALNPLGAQPGGQSSGPKLQQQLLGQQMQLIQQQVGQKQQSQQQNTSQQMHLQQSSGQQSGMQSPSPQLQMLQQSSTQNTQYQQHSNQQSLQFNTTQQVHLHLQSGQQMHNQQMHMQQQAHLIQKQQQGNIQQIHMSPVANQSHQLTSNQQIQQQAGHPGHVQQTSSQQNPIQQGQLQMQTSSGHLHMQTQNVNQQIQLQHQQASNQQSQMQQGGQLPMHSQGSGQLLHIQQQHAPSQQNQMSQLQMHQQQQGTHMQIQQSGSAHPIQLQGGIQLQQAQGGSQQMQLQQVQGGSQQMQMQQQGGPQQMQIQQQGGPQQLQLHQQGPQQMQMQQQGGQQQLQLQQGSPQQQMQMQQQQGGPQQMQLHQQQVGPQQMQMQQQSGPLKLQMQQKPGGPQQMQMQQGQQPQMQMQQGGPQQMQMQQGGPQQMQMQQVGTQQMQMQQGVPQQMQMQQGASQQMQMQQGGPQQMQMQMQQSSGPQPQHLQQHSVSSQQLQMQQQAGNQHIQSGTQQQLQMQQTQGGGQMQLQSSVQQQMQQPQSQQLQMQGVQMQLQPQQAAGTAQQIQMQQGVAQQMPLQSQKNTGQQLQMPQGMQQIRMQSQGGSPSMHMQIQQQNSGQLQSQVGGTQVLQQTTGQQQNSVPMTNQQMSLQGQTSNQQLQTQPGNQMNQQAQNIHQQPQYQFQLQQGGQQVVQLLQLPPQLQQSLARGQGGATLQMRQQGLISQQSVNIGQLQMSPGPQRHITATQQQLQQLRQSIPVGQLNTQQRPMQGHQQIIHSPLQQQINKVQISGGQHVVNVGSQQNQMQHTVMTMQQGQGQQGMQTQQPVPQQLQQLLQQPQQQQGIRQSSIPRQQVPMSMSPGGNQPQQSTGAGQQKVVFAPSNPRQITQEIVRQIQQDPQLKAQFAMMDPQQRTLLIQQFAQRQRDRDQQMLLQQKMVNQQVQQQRFVTPGNVQGNAQRPQTQMVVTQQPGGVVQTQQIFTPPVGSPRLNVRHVVVHQQQRLTHPQQVQGNMQQQQQGHIQTQQIIVHQQQGTTLPPQQSPQQHATGVSPIILQTSSPQQQQAQKQQLPQGSPGMNQQQVIQIQVPSQSGHPQLVRQPSQTNIAGQMQVGAQQSPPQNQPVGQRTQTLSGANSIIIQGQQILTPHSQQQLQQGSKIALIQSSQQWASPGGTVVRSPSPAGQMQSQVSRPGVDSSSSPTGTGQQQWSLRQTSPVGSITFPVTQANMPYVQVVNSKTKTALANLLSNRLQGNSGPESNAGTPVSTPTAASSQSPQQQIVMCPPPPPSHSQSPHASLSPQQTQVVPQQNVLVQRRTLTTMGTSPKASPGPLARPPGSGPPAPPAGATLPLPAPRTPYYGHDPNIKLPSDGFLLGCIFWAPVSLVPKNWHLAVEQYGGEVEVNNSPRVTHVVCENTKFPEFQHVLKEGKRVVTLNWLNDICLKKCVKPPYYATHLPVPFASNERPLEGEQVGLTGFSGEDKQRVKIICKILGADVVRHLAMGMKMLIAQKPEGTKFTKAREWKMPVVNIQFLNELLFGHLSSLKSIHSPKYQHFSAEPFRFDTTLVPHILAPWKVPLRINQESLEKYKTRKRLLEVKGSGNPDAKKPKLACDEYDCDTEPLTPPEIPVDENHPNNSMDISNETGSAGDMEVEKKPTINDKKPIAIMLSGFTKEYKEKITKKVISLGAKVTTDFRETTHLIMKESIRTNKLFVCLSRARYIVTLNWLHECLRNKKFVDAEPFIMSNETIEKVYGVKLKDLLAKPDRHFLFANVTFYITPSCFPSIPDLKDIIEAAGGSVDTRQRSLQHARQQATKTPRRYVIITCVQDFKLVADACKRHAIHLHTPEFIFESIAKQKFKPMKTIARLQPTVDKLHGSFKLPLQSKKN